MDDFEELVKDIALKSDSAFKDARDYAIEVLDNGNKISLNYHDDESVINAYDGSILRLYESDDTLSQVFLGKADPKIEGKQFEAAKFVVVDQIIQVLGEQGYAITSDDDTITLAKPEIGHA
tara:strand:- start:1209 stop:1571 length:363 start_codon:yes stop_codon:yes gene_type:complete